MTSFAARSIAPALLALGFSALLPGQEVWSPMHGIGPAARDRHALAYDSQRRKVVLFGGHDGAAALGDTWEWSGSYWTRVATSGPAPRWNHAMTYDTARGRVVMFGGDDGTSTLGDTWEWDGSAWSASGAAGPAPRAAHGMTYDTARGRVVMFGGDGGASSLGDTWQWDGSSWTQVVTATGPVARSAHALAYDALRNQTVLFGGENAATRFGDTWLWNGSSWTRGAKGGPSARSGHALAFDDHRKTVVLFGGDSGGALEADTWVLDGSSWTRSTASGPTARSGHAMVHDARRRRVTVFGGRGSGALADTWVFACTPWCDLGQPTRGTHGIPVLVGQGDLVGGSSMTLTLSNVLPQSTAFLMAGVSPINVPIAGGMIVPNPVLILPVATLGTAGSPATVLVGPLNLPAETPSGGTMYFQFWMLDPAGSSGLAASNAVVGTTRLSLFDRISVDFNAMLRRAQPPSSSLAIYSVQDFTNRLFVRNPTCWAAQIDLTGVSPWNQAHVNKRAGTLVSPRHLVFAKHYPLSAAAGNNDIAFVTDQDVTVIRKIVGLTYPVADIGVALLDADVPADIAFYRVLPRNWNSYLQATNNLPMLHLDQEEKALVRDMSQLNAGASYCSHKVPADPTRRSFFETLISGDSGNPAFILVNGEPILMLTHHYATAGPFYTTHMDAVNSAMTQLGGGYQLTEADLSVVAR